MGFYNTSNLFEIGLSNAKFLTKAISINDILIQNNLFRFLGTLFYAEKNSIEDLYNEPKDSVYFVDKKIFEKILGNFHYLKEIFFESYYKEEDKLKMLESGTLKTLENDIDIITVVNQNNDYFNCLNIFENSLNFNPETKNMVNII